MFRKQAAEKEFGFKDGFRMRGGKDISRIEGFSDAVFAFAITLLVVSLEVPKTFNELFETMKGFIPFAIGFTLLFQMWYNQYIFFRRYGLEDSTTVVLNAILLFVILFFVYPVKFLFTWLVSAFLHGDLNVHLADGKVEKMVSADQASTLMIIYGLGFAAVSLVFALLYRHAFDKREELELTEIEIFDTWHSIRENYIDIGVAGISISLALIGPQYAFFSGISYALIGPAMWLHGEYDGKRKKKLLERIEKELNQEATGSNSDEDTQE